MYKITNTTEEGLKGLPGIVEGFFKTAAETAESGAASIATAVQAMKQVSKMGNIDVKKQAWGGSTATPTAERDKNGTWTVKAGSYTYSNIIAANSAEAFKLAEEAAKRTNIAGFKMGGLISSDGLYRAGEFGLKEAVIPLEQPRALRAIGEAIAQALPTREMFAPLGKLIGLENAGVTLHNRRQEVYSNDYIADLAARKVVAAIDSRLNTATTQPVNYYAVGTLIGDERKPNS